ncbi:MAG TPA: serine/threonine-protein kinase [Tepidisphaeraceae bacterium]|nr:serine/threonine-protein kinase [Tepidisphaeraceae bacterium]
MALKMILSGQYAGATSAPASSAKRGRSRRCGTRTWCRCTTPASTTAAPTTPWNWSRGGTLAARLARVPLAPAEATALLEPIADAVHAAHEAGIVHGDLKPGNILLGRDGAPKIAEFGLARRTDAGDETITLSGSGPGTPSYMAPEQVTGGPGAVGPAADVYGAGAVLYEVLTGRPPFRGDSAAETARQVLSDEPAPPSRLNGRVPRDLETICLKCLAKEPGRRYASSAALAEDLRRYRRGEPITARRSGRIEPSVKWARRKPATAALVLVLAGGSGGLWLASERAAAARAAAVDVDEANVLQRQGDWDHAAGALARAE